MSEHSPTPWKTDGVYIVAPLGPTIADCKRSPSMDLGTARANAAFIVKAVNSHDNLVKALENVRKIIAEGALTGFNYKDGDWAERLFESQQVTSAALAMLKDRA